MRGLRQFLLKRRRLALWLVAFALALKALVPAGYMVREQGTLLTIAICGDASGTHVTRQIVVPQRDTTAVDGAQHAKSTVCPYSVLDMAGGIGADSILLGLALVFILALGLAPHGAPEPLARPHVRPPLRGPPLAA
jgi:hypothetical protein